MTEYEVKCPQTWAWYTGFVHDYDDKQKKLLMSYPDDWKQTEWVDINTVRYKFDSSILSGWKPRENEEVECKARAEEREPYGWWLCKSNKYLSDDSKQQQQDNLYNVSFKGWGDQHNEILSIEFIRPKSQSKILSARNMYRETYNVPLELKEWVIKHTNNGEILDILMPHKNISAQIIHIGYLSDDNKLLLIGNKRVLITMKDIIYCFFERQKTLLKLEHKTKEMELRSKMKREEELKAEKFTFNIHPFLSGYLRGKHGGNIERVKKLYNGKIIKIDPQLQSVYIAAKDKISLKNAVDQLQIVCKKVIIPRDEMGQIIGSKGNQIQDIKRKSQVIKIISLKKWPDEFRRMKDLQTGRYAPQKTNGHTNGGDEGAEYQAPTIPDIIRNATIDNIFDDVIDLTAGYEPSYVPPTPKAANFDNNYDEESYDRSNEFIPPKIEPDALVIIGRRSRVDLCTFMIEMTLSHFRSITKTKRNVSILKNKINEIKGTDRRRSRPYQQRYRQQQQQQQNWDEQKDGSPPQQDRYYRGGRGRGDRRRGGGRGRGDRRRGGRGDGGGYTSRSSGGARQYQRKSNYNNGYDRGYNDEMGQQQQQYGQSNEYQTERQYDDNNNAPQQSTQQMQGDGDGGASQQQQPQTEHQQRRRKRKRKGKKKGGQSQAPQQTEQQAST